MASVVTLLTHISIIFHHQHHQPTISSHIDSFRCRSSTIWSIPSGVETQWQIIGALLQLCAMPGLGEAITHGRWSQMLDPSCRIILLGLGSWGSPRIEVRMYRSFKVPGLKKTTDASLGDIFGCLGILRTCCLMIDHDIP